MTGPNEAADAELADRQATEADDVGEAPVAPVRGEEPEQAEQPELAEKPGLDEDTVLADQPELAEPVEVADLAPSLEAILMACDEPVPVITLAQVTGAPVDQVRATLNDLAQTYVDRGHGFELREFGGGWRFYTNPRYAAQVERFVTEGQQGRLSQAALETLAVVAYRQPVSRSRISAIRGVNVDGVIRTLLSRGLIAEKSHEEGTGASLYGTTEYFLERMGMMSLDDLPPIAPLLPELDEELSLADGFGE